MANVSNSGQGFGHVGSLALEQRLEKFDSTAKEIESSHGRTFAVVDVKSGVISTTTNPKLASSAKSIKEFVAKLKQDGSGTFSTDVGAEIDQSLNSILKGQPSILKSLGSKLGDIKGKLGSLAAKSEGVSNKQRFTKTEESQSSTASQISTQKELPKTPGEIRKQKLAEMNQSKTADPNSELKNNILECIPETINPEFLDRLKKKLDTLPKDQLEILEDLFIKQGSKKRGSKEFQTLEGLIKEMVVGEEDMNQEKIAQARSQPKQASSQPKNFRHSEDAEVSAPRNPIKIKANSKDRVMGGGGQKIHMSERASDDELSVKNQLKWVSAKKWSPGVKSASQRDATVDKFTKKIEEHMTKGKDKDEITKELKKDIASCVRFFEQVIDIAVDRSQKETNKTFDEILKETFNSELTKERASPEELDEVNQGVRGGQQDPSQTALKSSLSTIAKTIFDDMIK